MTEATVVGQGVASVSGVVLLGLAYRTYTSREKPAAASFGGLLAILGVTALCAGATAHTGTLYKLVWLYTGLAIPVALAVFAFDYYGLAFFTSRTRTAAAVAPALAGGIGGTLVVLGTPAMSPGTQAPVAALATIPGLALDFARTLNQIGLYYTTAVMLLAIALVGRTVYRYDHLDARLGPVIVFVGLWPWVANLFVPRIAGAVTPGAGVLAVASGYAGSVVVAALAIGPLGLFESSPMAGNVGPETVLNSMEDAVLVVDDEGRVLRLNDVACRVFDTTEPEAVGGPLTAVIEHRLERLVDQEAIEVDTTGGTREFEVIRSAVTDRTGTDRGYAIVLRDVTERRTREQRLEVFNRILRHNLRNDATSIIGHAQLIADGGDPEPAADRIVDTTRDLVDVAERAREIERMMTATPGDENTAIRPAVEDITRRIETEYPGVEVTTAIADGATAAVAPQAFEVVVDNLVENAAEHNDADEPIVVVSAEYDADGTVVLAVADNGPGIPEHERSVLAAGGEDQLNHGSGLGLWAVQWGVTRMGGELAFAENDPRGSVVTLRLPTTDGDETPADRDARPASAG